MPFEQQAVVIYAAINGHLERVAAARVPEFEEKLLAFFDSNAKVVLESIRNSKNIVVQTEEELKHQLKKFEETHPNLFQGSTLTPGLSKVEP
jgi:F-type H+-transporting ATPase subunit alpha